MAEFKRALGGSGSGEGFGFDGTTVAAFGDMAGMFWPVILGTVILLVLAVKGDHQAVIPVGGGMILLQAWQSGVFG